jgi:hypothetical protein
MYHCAVASLDLDDIQSICQNGQTLQVLYFACWGFDTPSKFIKDLFSNCAHLTEISIFSSGFSVAQIQALVDNFWPG